MKKPTAKAGEEIRLYCGDCLTEYEVLLEPKAKGAEDDGYLLGGSKVVAVCPFCGKDEQVEEC